MSDLASMIDAAVAARNFGVASARKAGRNSRWPYVPIVDHRTGWNKAGHTEQIRGLAYATRDEAVRAAQRTVDARREGYRAQLSQPRYRALRKQAGLPEEIEIDERLQRRRKAGHQ